MTYSTPGAQSGPESSTSPDWVINNTWYRINATTSHPYRAIVYVQLNNGHYCTGYMINKNTVVTAGHCVYDNGHWIGISWVAPGKNGSSNPYGTCGWVREYSVTGWTQNHDSNYDYGAIKLNCSIGNTVGTIGLYWNSDNSYYQGRGSTVTGYPDIKPYATMWRGDCHITSVTAYKLFYCNDTAGGDSGAPVYEYRGSGQPWCTGYCAMAINTDEYDPPTMNSGTRITQGVFNNLVNWENS